MKRIFLLFLLALTAFSIASAESLPASDSGTDTVFSPAAGQTPEPEAGSTSAPAAAPAASDDDSLVIDFTLSTPENPAATPVAVDPIDKPTPTPTPAPNFVLETYTNERMGVSFSIPYTWLLNPNTNQETTIQFVEPKSEMMEPDGYQTRITIEKVNMGLDQTAADARTELESTLEELGSTFSSFKSGSIDNAKMSDANGYYCYYKAEYNDGTKTYEMNGRIMIVAKGKALYQVRITTPRNWYSYYENVFRTVRSTFKFL